MSALEAFLTPVEELKTIEVSFKRFRNADGTPAVIKMRSISAEKNSEILKRCRIKKVNNGVEVMGIDNDAYLGELMLEMIVEPNFRDKTFVEKMGKVSPVEALRARFTADEYVKLTNAVNELLGVYGENPVDQAKN